MFQSNINKFIVLITFFNSYAPLKGMLSGCKKELPRDIVIRIAATESGALRNKLQKINTFFNKVLSIKNVQFLMLVDLTSVAPIDKEKIWLNAFWKSYYNHNKKIMERFKPQEDIFFRSCYATAGDFVSIPKESTGSIKISLSEIKQAKQVVVAAVLKEGVGLEGARKLLQSAMLCSDDKLVSLCISFFSDQSKKQKIYFANQYMLTLFFLQECMYRNNQATFEEFIINDPFDIVHKTFSENCKSLYPPFDHMLKNTEHIHVPRKEYYCRLYDNLCAQKKFKDLQQQKLVRKQKNKKQNCIVQ